MLPDLIPLEESRKLALRLLEPYWKAFGDKNDDAAKFGDLILLAMADPRGVLQRLDETKFPDGRMKDTVQTRVCLMLARSDPAEAEIAAEAIEEPGARARRCSGCSMPCRTTSGSKSSGCSSVGSAGQSRDRPGIACGPDGRGGRAVV